MRQLREHCCRKQRSDIFTVVTSHMRRVRAFGTLPSLRDTLLMWESDSYATLRIGTEPEITDFDRALSFQPKKNLQILMDASIRRICRFFLAVNSNLVLSIRLGRVDFHVEKSYNTK